MQHAALVRIMHGCRHAFQVACCDPCREGTIAHQFRQRPSGDELHRKEVPSLVLSNFMDGDDVRMAEPRRCCRLGLEPGDGRVASQHAMQDHLHRHIAAQAHLPRQIHNPHAAARDLFEQFVIAQTALVGVQIRCSHIQAAAWRGRKEVERDATWTKAAKRFGVKPRPAMQAGQIHSRHVPSVQRKVRGKFTRGDGSCIRAVGSCYCL